MADVGRRRHGPTTVPDYRSTSAYSKRRGVLLVVGATVRSEDDDDDDNKKEMDRVKIDSRNTKQVTFRLLFAARQRKSLA
uniref:Uncharacterized protein n=1 Tax=Vespula pensylvanica TaxID=30213 RepID=A0A834JK77_VESPE|nr:hypothetical protein H0235_018223 [Vespula pensylvanica]